MCKNEDLIMEIRNIKLNLKKSIKAKLIIRK